MTTIRRAGLALVACLALALGTAACASPHSGADAPPSAPPDSTDTDQPATVNPDGTVTVTTRHRTMVIEDGDRPPQLCVGGVQESLPPNCSGVELVGWNWDAVGGAYDEQGRMDWGEVERGPVRWGEFTVTGDYSRANDRLTVVSVEPGGPEAEQPEVCPDGSPTLAPHERPVFDEAASQFVAERFGISVSPGYSDECGRLTIGVVFDDGSIQAALDEMSAEGPRTLVESALVPVGGAATSGTSDDTLASVGTPVRTLVIDDGERPPQLCVGLHQQSLPPQCAGVNLIGWEWDAVPGTFDERGTVRWGYYFVDGDYARHDNTLTVTRATADGPDIGRAWEPWTCDDDAVRSEGVPPTDPKTVTSHVEEELGVPVFISGTDHPCEVVSILVAYDDGTLQAELDEVFGEGAVRVASALSLRG